MTLPCGIKKTLCLLLTLLCGTLLPTACDKLDDGDDNAINEVLPGRWAFSYAFEGDAPDFYLDFREVVFEADGTCAITYIDDYRLLYDADGQPVVDADGMQLSEPVYAAYRGTYRAGSSVIRIVSTDVGNQEHVLLWRVLSFSPRLLTAEYDFEDGGQQFTAVVTLEKI